MKRISPVHFPGRADSCHHELPAHKFLPAPNAERRDPPHVWYGRIQGGDGRRRTAGIEQALRIQRAAGAEFVYGPHNDSIGFNCKENSSQRDFESFLSRVHSMGTRPNHFGQFCAHQMSSCRIADSEDRGVISPEGETYEVKNLFVADGSVLPTSTGVNPMITIMATAHHIAQQIKAKLPK